MSIYDREDGLRDKCVDDPLWAADDRLAAADEIELLRTAFALAAEVVAQRNDVRERLAEERRAHGDALAEIDELRAQNAELIRSVSDLRAVREQLGADALADERAHADRLAEALADPADDDAARAHRALLVSLHAHRRAGEP